MSLRSSADAWTRHWRLPEWVARVLPWTAPLLRDASSQPAPSTLHAAQPRRREGLGGVRVELRGVCVRRGGCDVLDRASLVVEPGELLVIMGPSGAGKSTLLSTINGLVRPDAGDVLVDGHDVRAAPPHVLRRNVGYCFQGLGLFPHLTVAENVGITPRLAGWPEPRIRARVDELLAGVGLGDPYRERLPRELSGGQAQRVALARALSIGPPLLLLDEPFGALDPDTRARLERDVAAIHARLGMTTILVSHDLGEALLLGTRVAVVIDGRVVQHGRPRDVVQRPASREVAALVEPDFRRAREITALVGGP